MGENGLVHRNWLKAMYVYTAIGAGGFGFMSLFLPNLVQSAFRFPGQDPAVFKLYGSVSLASGLIALLALRSPLKFVPMLFFQLIYKPVWLAAVAIPLFIEGRYPLHVVAISVIFLTYIVGDLIAIPFRYLFSKEKAIAKPLMS